MYKSGLKLWSRNTDYYYNEAVRLYENGVFDYIELYVVPDTIQNIELWKKLDIPYLLHAPHFAHELNLAKENYFEYNKKIYEEVEQYRKELNPKYTVVHSGTEGSIDETIRQLNIIKPKNFIIENKPYRAPLGDKELCRGYSIEEISKVINETDCGFCLDVGHAICAANSLGFEPYEYLKAFNKLKPVVYHISGLDIDSEIDKHLHLDKGNYDLEKILSIIDEDKLISIETSKDSKTNLNDFIEDINYLKQKIKRKGSVR